MDKQNKTRQDVCWRRVATRCVMRVRNAKMQVILFKLFLLQQHFFDHMQE